MPCSAERGDVGADLVGVALQRDARLAGGRRIREAYDAAHDEAQRVGVAAGLDRRRP